MLSRLMTRREQLLLLGVAVSIAVGSVALWWDRSRPAPPSASETVLDKAKPTDKPSPIPKVIASPKAPVAPKPIAHTVSPKKPPPPEKPSRIGVGITGAVKSPGLYYFDSNARVGDLIQSAGGITPEADVSRINQAAPLIDSTTLAIPARETVPWNSGGQHHRKSADAAWNPQEYLR